LRAARRRDPSTFHEAQEKPPSEQSPMLRIRARVLDAAGQPIVNAGVAWGSATGITTADALLHPQGRSKADGTLDFSVPQRSGRSEQRPRSTIRATSK
jgi:hypothetical protein